jgi:iron-sulfur cluster repair protein YtfE (RIC family)
MNLERFENQHVKILHGIGELRRLSQQGIATNASAIASALVELSATIKLHLAAEDRMLYPMACREGDVELVHMAQRYQNDMGPIAAEFDTFARRWNTAAPLRAHPEEFRREANAVLRMVWERMHRENREFYPRVQAMQVMEAAA